MSDSQDVIGMGQADDNADLGVPPEPVDVPADPPVGFDDIADGADWNASAEEAPPVFDPTQDAPMPDDLGSDGVPTGDTTEPPPGAYDPDAPVGEAPPLPPITADGLPPELPDGVDPGGPELTAEAADALVLTDPDSTSDQPAPSPWDTSAPPPPIADSSEEPPPPGSSSGGDGVAPPPPPPPLVGTGTEPSTEFQFVGGAFVDDTGQSVDPAAAGLWHDGNTVYDADGDIVWTGNSPIAHEIVVPEAVSSFMATTPVTDVPEVLPPALPATPYDSVPEDDAMQLVQGLVGPSTGDTYATLLDQFGALSSDGNISTDEFGAFLVDHAGELGALTIPAGGAGDPEALRELAAQFGPAEGEWTERLASAVLDASSGDHVPDTRIYVSPTGELVHLGPEDPTPGTDGTLIGDPPETLAVETPAGETIPPDPGGGVDTGQQSEYRLDGDQLTDGNGNPVSYAEAGVHWSGNGVDVLDAEGNVVWTQNDPVGAPHEMPEGLKAYLATSGPMITSYPGGEDPTSSTTTPGGEDPTSSTTTGEQSIQELLAKQQAMQEQLVAMGTSIDQTLVESHAQWIAETQAMLNQHDGHLLGQIGTMMHDQEVRIIASIDGKPPVPVTVTHVEPTRVVGDAPDGTRVAVDGAVLERALAAATDKADTGGDDDGTSPWVLLGIGGAIVVPAVVAGGVVANKKRQARNAMAGS
ncbi:MAG: hypothetical protein ACHQDC_09145 [Acidimicrobiales bacterium]